VATLRKAFSLNDIFFYRRTLFCGSQAMFNDALEAISASDGDVAKVLSEQFNIDANSDEAVAFVELIQPYLY
jgi:ferredoxin-NADP reductase